MNKEIIFNINRHLKGAIKSIEKAEKDRQEALDWLEGTEFTEEQKELIRKRILTKNK